MATRIPQQSSQSQTGVRSSGVNRGPVDDGTVFSSMNEFRFWIIIVTLLIFLNFVAWMGILYMDKKLKRTEVILLRAEQLEKDKKSDKRKEDPDAE